MPDGAITKIFILIFLVLMSAYFSATETAFSSLNRTKLKALAEKGNKSAIRALRLSENYDRLLSTILIGNNIVNISATSIATILFIQLCGGDVGATVSTITMTVIVLIFGEITPKSVAKDCAEKFAMFSSPLLQLLIYLFMPLNFLFSLWKKLLSKIFHLETDTKMSHEELLMLVEEVQQDGSVDENEGNLLRNAIEFTERKAEDILTHRVDLEAVSIDSSKEEIAKVFSESKFSRILVFDGDIDHIVGVIHLKDFYTGTGITDKSIREILTPAVFVLKSEKINDILRELQKQKSHIAVVIDEFGGTYGIVTMEDVLEELVGEIWDEHDEESQDVQKISTDTYTVDGSMDMEDFCDQFHIEVETDAVSLGGWIMEQIGKIPECGDSFVFGRLSIQVTGTDNHRISTAEVKILPEESEEEDDESPEAEKHD